MPCRASRLNIRILRSLTEFRKNLADKLRILVFFLKFGMGFSKTPQLPPHPNLIAVPMPIRVHTHISSTKLKCVIIRKICSKNETVGKKVYQNERKTPEGDSKPPLARMIR